MPQPITLYYWPAPNGKKVAIFPEEADLPYELVPVDITAGEQFDEEFLKISPNNKMPAIVDLEGPDGQPISIFESGAILVYLAEKTGMFYPSTPRERYLVLQWLMFQIAHVGRCLVKPITSDSTPPRRSATPWNATPTRPPVFMG
jgi:GSH-dependent disulfide-bond oxidoreductase